MVVVPRSVMMVMVVVVMVIGIAIRMVMVGWWRLLDDLPSATFG
jgi:hypothetical protein